MRTLGALAAQDHAAWRGVRLAKDVGRQILMACVGIHHRLIVAIDDDQMAVLDLVSREALLNMLKRLRGTLPLDSKIDL